MSEDETKAKQNYLREKIIDAGLDPNKFVEHLVSAKGILPNIYNGT